MKAQQLDLLQAIPSPRDSDSREKALTEHLLTAQRRIQALETSLREAQAAQAAAEGQIALLQQQLRHAKTGMNGSADAGLIRALLCIAHPDKWSQGQLATELAHELTVQLTSKRYRR